MGSQGEFNSSYSGSKIENNTGQCSRLSTTSGLFHSVVMLSSLTQTSLYLTWNTSHQVQQRNGLITVSSHVQFLSGESRGERDYWERHVPDFCFSNLPCENFNPEQLINGALGASAPRQQLSVLKAMQSLNIFLKIYLFIICKYL